MKVVFHQKIIIIKESIDFQADFARGSFGNINEGPEEPELSFQR